MHDVIGYEHSEIGALGISRRVRRDRRPERCGKTTLLNFMPGCCLTAPAGHDAGERQARSPAAARSPTCSHATRSRPGAPRSATPSLARRSRRAGGGTAQARLDLLDKVGLKGFEEAIQKPVARHAQRVALAHVLPRCADPADGRAVRRARCADQAAARGRAAVAVAARAAHRRVHHPRSRRSRVDVRSRHRHERAARRIIASADHARTTALGARAAEDPPTTSFTRRSGASWRKG